MLASVVLAQESGHDSTEEKEEKREHRHLWKG